MHDNYQENHTLRAKEAANFLNVGISTLWRWSKEGRLPPGIRLSRRCTVWRVSDLKEFVSYQAQANETRL